MKVFMLEGHEIVTTEDLMKWSKWILSDTRIVNKSIVGPGIEVSTVFLGGIHSLFETMIFGGLRDRECHRYSTWDEAEIGHDKIVASFEVAGGECDCEGSC